MIKYSNRDLSHPPPPKNPRDIEKNEISSGDRMRSNVGEKKKGFRKETKNCTSLKEGIDWDVNALEAEKGIPTEKKKETD